MASAAATTEPTSGDRAHPVTVSEQEYLRSVFRPDCDFVNGLIEERSLGEFEHSRVQLMLARIFGDREREWGVVTAPECRLQVAANRYRIPDLMILRRGQGFTRIIREAPLICIEVLSPEDTWSRMRDRLDDYLAMGVAHIWCFEPETREVRRYTAEGFSKVIEPALTVHGTAVRIELAAVFAILDQDDTQN